MPSLISRGIVLKKGKERTTKEQVFEKAKIDSVYISITTRCNLNCKMCFSKFNMVRTEDELTAEEIEKFADEVINFCESYANISISGGEPLIVPEKTLEVAEYLRSKFKYVWIVTNGTLINRKIARKFRDLGVLAMVSLDGATEREHDFLRGRGAFKKTIRGIKILKEEDVYVVTNCIIHKHNLKNLDNYFELAKGLGIDEVRFIPLKLVGGALNANLDKVYIDEIVDYAYDMFIKHPEYEELRGRDIFTALGVICRRCIKQKWCGAGKLLVSLNADGNVYPCPSHWSSEFAAGNIRLQSFSDIWLNSPVLKKLREIYSIETLNEECSRCIVKYWCAGGCRAEAYYNTFDLRSPSVECEHIKRAILNMFWILADHPRFGKLKEIKRRDYQRGINSSLQAHMG